MPKEEEIQQLLEDIAWLEELIEEAVNDPNLDKLGQKWLRNLIQYWKRDKKKLMQLLNTQ